MGMFFVGNNDSNSNTTADPSGNSYTYDAENKMLTAANGSTLGNYVYAGDRKRVKKYNTSNGDDAIFVYDAFDKLIEERDLSGNLQTAYIYAGSRLLSTETSSGTTYLTADHLGSPRINTDGSGNVVARHDYMPFGEEIFTALTAQRTSGAGYSGDTVRKQFASYERDIETELDFAEARYYNFNHGRFITSDPLLVSGRIEDPQTWNRYAYVLNNPLNYIDPTGLYECKGNKTQCQQFETRLNQARENLKKIEEKYGKDSKQYEKAAASINAYGVKDEKNGVFVAFDRKKSGANTTGTFADNGKGKLISITVHFNADALDDDSSQALVGHEGVRIP